MAGLTWQNATPARPCPICGKPDWCAVSADGRYAVCRRVDTGTSQHKIDKAGMHYFVYRLDGEPIGDPPELEPPATAEPERADPDVLHCVYTTVLDALALEDHHLADLRARGLPDEEIVRRGYRSLPPMGRKRIADAVRSKGFGKVLAAVPGFHIVGGQYWSFAGAGGLLIPVRDVKRRIVALKTRKDERKQGARYSYVSSRQYGGSGPGSPVHIPLFEGDTKVVRLTEGELKADVATALDGMLTVSIPGVSAWRRAVPVLRELMAKTVRLAFDGDIRTNRNVARALHHTVQSMATDGFAMELELWDGTHAKGIDDLLAKGGKPEVLTGETAFSAMTQILEEAERADPSPSELVLNSAHEMAAALAELAKSDKGAAFAPQAIHALALLRAHDLPAFIRARDSLRSAKVPLRELDRAVAQEQSRVPRANSGQQAERSPVVDGEGREDDGNRAGALPLITVNDRDLRDITKDALDALLEANDPPVLFQRGALLTRIREDDHGRPFLAPLTDPALRGCMARTADWRREDITEKGEVVLRPVFPPDGVVKDLAALPEWLFPPLLAIAEAPIFASDGTLVDGPGYHAGACVWYHAAPGLEIRPVPEQPTAADIEHARNLILNELFIDFPFTDTASRAHAVAVLLQPFLRLLIDGPTPLYLIDKPSPGTGAGLLADVITIPATGRSADVMSEARDDDELRKRLTSILLKAPAFVLIDNIRRRLDSAQLSALLTATTWTDRILGGNVLAVLPIMTTFLATGNNVAVSNEIARRTVWIHLDAKVDRPWERTGFRHSDLHRWAHEHRGDLVWAALVLGRVWLAAGRPVGECTLGGFEAWSKVLGGVLTVAGIEGFLGNLAMLYERADEESQEWRAFVRWWAEHFGEREVLAGELFKLATENDLISDVLGDKGERSQRTRLGKALGRMRDRVIEGFRIDGTGTDKSGRQTYRLRHYERTEAVRPTGSAEVRDTSDQCMPNVCDDQNPSVSGVSADVAYVDIGLPIPTYRHR